MMRAEGAEENEGVHLPDYAYGMDHTLGEVHLLLISLQPLFSANLI